MSTFEPGLTHAEAISTLFQINLNKHPVLRNQLKAYTEGKTRLIEQVVIPKGTAEDTKSRFIPRTELTKLHNVVLLAGIFGKPDTVKKIFNEPGFRKEMAQWLRTLFLHRQSVVGIGLHGEVVSRFIGSLEDIEVDLSNERLPNPFEILPQLALEGKSDLAHALILQSSLLSSADNMMLAYLNGDLKKAFEYSQAIDFKEEIIQKYCALIRDKYEEKVNFRGTLKKFR